MYCSIYFCQIQALKFDQLKVVDKIPFVIYNENRKRQDLKRLCQKRDYFIKNNASLVVGVIFLWLMLVKAIKLS